MHRSGTSAVARIVNLAGAAISERLMAPQADNPKGFWESLPITQLHDQALAGLGLAWDSIERVPDDWFRSAAAATLRAALAQQLRADFPDGRSFVMKDPRVCRFVPAWLQVLAELHYTVVAIMPFRNPLEVAQSLERRNGFPIAKSLLLWLRHVLDAEAGTRQLPHAFIDYAALLADWRRELSGVNRQLGFDYFSATESFEQQLGRYLSVDDRHHVASVDALREADRLGWATEAFAALSQLRSSSGDADRQDPVAILDRIRGALDEAETVVEPFLSAYRSQVLLAKSSQDEALAAARQDAERRRAEAATFAARVEEREQALTQLGADLQHTRSLLVTRSDQLHDAREHARQLEERLASEAAATARLAAEHQAEKDAAAALRVDRESVRLSWEESERHAVRSAGIGHASLRRRAAESSPAEALLRLLSDAQVPPSQWLARPLRSARNLFRLRGADYRLRVNVLARSGLFDRDFYARLTPGLSANLVARFLIAGDAAGERAHLLFDPAWYRQRNPDVQAVPPLQHYLLAGGWELRSPHPLFDPVFYLSQWVPADVEDVTPLTHFLNVGGAAGVSPHPLFDAFHYLRARPDVAAAGMNPLLHYVTVSPLDAADPHPLFSNQFYLQANPDVQTISALEHFVRHGASEGRWPHPLFDVAYYWRQRPEVQAASINPLEHFLAVGASEGTDPHPLFSCRHYESQLGPAWDRRVNPLVHYLRWGRHDLLNPHPGFDARLYCAAYPDAASSGLAPLLHYVLYGGHEAAQDSVGLPTEAREALVTASKGWRARAELNCRPPA